MKKIYSKPEAIVEEFVANEYVASCWITHCVETGKGHENCPTPIDIEPEGTGWALKPRQGVPSIQKSSRVTTTNKGLPKLGSKVNWHFEQAGMQHFGYVKSADSFHPNRS